ncbi:MAG: fructosamine kinase family protein [Bacteroidales bacterium]|nr:fructosamine kinase family protein [Bacteroidales bacterium]
MSWQESVEQLLSNKTGAPVQILNRSSVGGGSINAAYRLETTAGLFFTKVNSASRYPHMFEKEALGLQLLGHAGVISVPEVIDSGESGPDAFLVLKYIESKREAPNFWEDFGIRLARLHRQSEKEFGLDHDNYIGSLPQSNRKHKTWSEFFIQERLKPLAKMAFEGHLLDNRDLHSLENFERQVDEIFPNEPPALIHGDLWSGNFMVNEEGTAVIIDPAVYFGHREMDLGMSQLFGGFHSRFYEAYHREYPLAPGWQKRLDYCNLYPLLVHVNLFGGGYVGSFRSILRSF